MPTHVKHILYHSSTTRISRTEAQCRTLDLIYMLYYGRDRKTTACGCMWPIYATGSQWLPEFAQYNIRSVNSIAFSLQTFDRLFWKSWHLTIIWCTTTSSLHCVSKTVPTFQLSVTLSNVNRLESVQNLLQNPYDTTHLTLGMLLHYLGKLKMQIICRYSAHMRHSVVRYQYC